jgi:RNA polymerase sigma-70 factor (sigma-E family)
VDPASEIEFRRFVSARWPALQRYAYLLTGDHHSAEDVVQTALEKCWARWDRIQAASPESYVRAAVANTAASRRRRIRFLETPFTEKTPEPPAPGDLAQSHADRSGLWGALADLSPRRRAIVVLRIWEDRPEAEVARILGISLGAVRSQLSTAMRQLRQHPQIRTAAGRPDLLADPRANPVYSAKEIR